MWQDGNPFVLMKEGTEARDGGQGRSFGSGKDMRQKFKASHTCRSVLRSSRSK